MESRTTAPFPMVTSSNTMEESSSRKYRSLPQLKHFVHVLRWKYNGEVLDYENKFSSFHRLNPEEVLIKQVHVGFP